MVRVDGDRATVMLRHEFARNGIDYRLEMVNLVSFRDGLLAEWSSYPLNLPEYARAWRDARPLDVRSGVVDNVGRASMAPPPPLHLAVALDGAGWHPAAWREPDARPSDLFSPGYWVDLVQEAERGLLDFVTIEDSLALQSTRRRELDERTDQVRGRLDAVLVAARVAPRTSSIGLVPVATTTHTEPFHVSKSIATLDYVSNGRAGLQARVSATGFEARQFGRREIDAAGPGAGAPGDAAAVGRPLRRGGGLRRGRAPPLGQLGGRRGDPRCGDGAVRRPGQAALHRLRRDVVLGQGPFDHPSPPAGSAAGQRPGPRPRRLRVGGARAPTSSSSRRTATDEARDLVATVRGHEEAEARPGPPLRIFADRRRLPRRRRRHRHAPARTGSTSCTAVSTAPTPSSTPARPVSSPICCSTGAPPGSRGFVSGPEPSPTTSRPSRADWSACCRTDRPSAAATRSRPCGNGWGSPGPSTCTPARDPDRTDDATVPAPRVPLGILDLVPVSSGSTAQRALRNTIDLVRAAEQLGYRRYWFAEHHLNPGVAGSAPALLIAMAAAATDHIRVGSGGVQSGHRTALSVVEEFGLLDAMYPGRIDLGIGRSGGRDFLRDRLAAAEDAPVLADVRVAPVGEEAARPPVTPRTGC